MQLEKFIIFAPKQIFRMVIGINNKSESWFSMSWY